MKRNYNTNSGQTNTLQEPSAIYASANNYQNAFSNISKQYIKTILKKAKLSLQEVIGILPISLDTYKRKTVFNSNVTEKVLEIEEVYNKGLSVFGDNFYSWMDTKNIALGNVPPKTLLQNSFGVRMLLDEIGRLEHGVLA